VTTVAPSAKAVQLTMNRDGIREFVNIKTVWINADAGKSTLRGVQD